MNPAMRQTAIPAPPMRKRPPAACAWCGARAVDELEIQPARYTTRKAPSGESIKLLKKSAIMAPVCAFHRDNLYVAPLPE